MQGAKSGEYGGCDRVTILVQLRNSCDTRALNIAVELGICGLAPTLNTTMSMFLVILWTCLVFSHGDVGLFHYEDLFCLPSDGSRHEGWDIQGMLMEILTDFGTEFLLIWGQKPGHEHCSNTVHVQISLGLSALFVAAKSIMDL